MHVHTHAHTGGGGEGERKEKKKKIGNNPSTHPQENEWIILYSYNILLSRRKNKWATAAWIQYIQIS